MNLLTPVAHQQFHFNAFLLFQKLVPQSRDDVSSVTDQTDGQGAGFNALQPCGGVLGVFEQGQHFAAVDQHVFASGGQADLAALAFKQRHADFCF